MRGLSSPLLARSTSRESGQKFRTGFTFLEVLFAIMILGIGIILISAIFPAGIKQTQATVEDQYLLSISRYGLRTINELARQIDLRADLPIIAPATLPQNKGRSLMDEYMRPWPSYKFAPLGPDYSAQEGYPRVYSFHDPRMALSVGWWDQEGLWKLTAGNLVLPSDPRYAWVGFFSRDCNSNYVDARDADNKFVNSATIYLIPVRCRNKSQYSLDPSDPNCDLTMTSGASTNLEPTLVKTTMDFTVSPPQVILTGVCSRSGQTNNPLPKAQTPDNNPFAQGCWLIVSDDRSNLVAPMPPTPPTPNLNGRIYRIGTQVPGFTDGYHWQIADDPQNSAFPTGIYKKSYPTTFVFIVGRGADPDQTASKGLTNTAPLTGPTQDLGIQTTVISFP